MRDILTNNKTLRDLVKKIFNKRKQSVWVVTTGKKQSGKTDFTLRLMEILYEENLADGFGANVKSLRAPFDIDFIQDFETLQERCKMLNPDPEKRGIKRYFFFGSEMGKWLPRDEPWRNTKFIKELQLVRKIGLNWLGDGINRIDLRVLSDAHFDGQFKKVSQMRPDIATYHDFATGKISTVEGIKRTSLKFNTWESCDFYMEPQGDTAGEIPLNQDHLIVKQYLEAGCSIAKTGLHSQVVKRARDNVLKYYFKRHLEPMKTEENHVSEASGVVES
jgi:hypothetical protein